MKMSSAQDTKSTEIQIGRIKQERHLSDVESLVLIHIETTNTHCIAIAVHPHNKPVSFRAAEFVSEENAPRAFARRALFNGRFANNISDNSRATSFDHTTLRLV